MGIERLTFGQEPDQSVSSPSNGLARFALRAAVAF
jgi:hypothetical protein